MFQSLLTYCMARRSKGIVQLHHLGMDYMLLILYCRSKKQVVGPGVSTLGGVTLKFLLPHKHLAIAEFLRFKNLASPDGVLPTIYRAEINGCIYYSRQYKRMQKRNSYTVIYNDSQGTKCFGFVDCFVFIHNKLIALINHINSLDISCTEHINIHTSCCTHIIPMKTTSSYSAVYASNITEKCLFIDFSHRQYLLTFPSFLFD